MRTLTAFWSFFLLFSLCTGTVWAQVEADSSAYEDRVLPDSLDRVDGYDTLYDEGVPVVISGTPIGEMPPPLKQYDPRKASILSATLPGLGQIYNDNWWKTPIIYAAFGTIGYFVVFNHNRYVAFRDVFFSRLDDNPTNDLLLNRNNSLIFDPTTDPQGAGIEPSEQQLRRGIERYQRDRDLLVIVGVVTYALQIVEAHIDAHLKEFRVAQELTASLGPSIQPGLAGTVPSLSLRFNLTQGK